MRGSTLGEYNFTRSVLGSGAVGIVKTVRIALLVVDLGSLSGSS